MIWNIMIVTKEYNKYVEFFCKKSKCCVSSRNITEIHTEFIRIIIIKYISPYQLRGYKAHLIYVDDDLIKNKELQEEFLPCIIYGNRCLLPISSLYLNI